MRTSDDREQESVTRHSGRRRRRRGASEPREASGPSAVPWIVGLLLVALPSISLPAQGIGLTLKTFLLTVGAIAAVVWVFSVGEWDLARLRQALLTPPNLAVVLFLLWVGLSAARSELPGVSRYEAMRDLGGGLVFFAVQFGVSGRRQLVRMAAFFAGAAGLAALLTLASSNEANPARVTGPLGNEQLLAALLSVLLPLVLVAALLAGQWWRRLVALVALSMTLAGIVAAQNRSAWLGTLAGLACLAVAFVRGGVLRRRRPAMVERQHAVPLLLTAVLMAALLAGSQSADLLAQRAGTLASLGRDVSFRWRLAMWDKAIRMIRDRPLTGWGVGTFPIQQALYYHPAAPSRQQRDILLRGITLTESAHNTYLELGAELGLPGLALYLAILGGFFVTALRAFGRHREGHRRAMLAAAVSAVAAQIVSAAGTPAWEFPECSLFLWAVLGFGMAAAGAGTPRHGAESEEPEEAAGSAAKNR